VANVSIGAASGTTEPTGVPVLTLGAIVASCSYDTDGSYAATDGGAETCKTPVAML
jgi:hypothetical protein